jgi:hypothetical protein
MKCFRVPQCVVLIVCAIFFAPSAFSQTNPEPAGWYAGDMHVHRSCGSSPEAVSSMFTRMNAQNLSSLSLLADMGNGEVQNPATDLPFVNGQNDPISTSSRILHWDAEWHWDATYSQYAHQALGGHLVGLGLTSAQQLWRESTYQTLDWLHQQNGVAGFAHMQYLDNGGLPSSLTCCTPIEYPVEVGLGDADFISEDVDHVNSGAGMHPENFIQAYYRLLNSGFRPGFAAGTDYPCNDGTVGSPLTYVQVAGGQMSYRNWIDGISKGKTVVSRNGHIEFLNLLVNGTATPGDEIQMANAGNVTVSVTWTATQNVTISGTYGTTRSTTLTVGVASLISLTLNPSTVIGGSPSTGTLTLNGAAPPSGALVSLTGSNTAAAQVPLNATVPGGTGSITFPVTTGAVHGTSSTIRGTYRSTSRSAVLTVR